MITLRDVSKSDESIFAAWQNDSKLTGYLSRLCPNNSSVVDYDTSDAELHNGNLPENLYSLLAKTHSDSDYNNLWTAIFYACEMFRIIALPVGKHFGFTYDQDEDTNMMEYLNRVKASCKNEMLGLKQNAVEFWQAVDNLVSESELVIDRPKGSRHPRYPDIVYQVDYGYLKGTTSMDGGGIDV